MCSECGATRFCTALCSAPRSGPRCYHDRVLHGLDIYPLAIFRDLEATNLIVLEEEDDAASIGVGAEAVNEVRAWAWRVVAHLRPDEGDRLVVDGVESLCAASRATTLVLRASWFSLSSCSCAKEMTALSVYDYRA
ncbi:hypothetical protein BHM03_00026470 [Ensete ventricosum]|nr:hypothetical protein BHM03_00026470 [Ensete ventricosum]